MVRTLGVKDNTKIIKVHSVVWVSKISLPEKRKRLSNDEVIEVTECKK